MSNPKDRITPLLFDELSEEEIAYWKKKEPWNFPANREEEKNVSKEPADK